MPSVLLVGHALPPSRRPCARRMLRLGEHLQRLGWRVTALSMRPRYTAPNDTRSGPAPPFEMLRTEALVPGAWLPRGSLAQRAVSRCARGLSTPDEHVGWLPFALAAVQGRRFDVVLATLPWFSSGVVGAAVAAQTDARLVLDYRDPWTDLLGLEAPVPAWRRAWHAALEARVLARATLVTAMTPTLATWLRARTLRPVHVIPNGIDDLPAPRPARPADELRLVYAGSLAYGRTLEPVLAAMALARPRLRRPMRLVVAGPHGRAVRSAAERLGIAELVEDRGEIDQAAAEALIAEADVGVVAVSGAYAYATPGKLFQIAGRTPVLLLGPLDGDAAALVTRHGLGWVRAEDDVPGLAGVLAAVDRGDVPVASDLATLTYAAIAGDLDGLLRAEALAPKGPPAPGR